VNPGMLNVSNFGSISGNESFLGSEEEEFA
jgi:hypothetical protein